MKKIGIIFGISLLFLLVFSFNVFASEEFVLRNDIKFGDSLETVKEKETLELDEEEIDEEDKSITYLETKSGEVANIPGTVVFYTFKDDKLIEMKYDFSLADFVLEMEDVIDRSTTVFAKLYEKYGLEFSTENIDDSYFKTSLYDTYLHYKEEGDKGEPIDIVNYNGCMVDNTDYSVKIETLSVLVNNTSYWPYVSYKYVSPDELNDYHEKVENYNNKLDNDL